MPTYTGFYFHPHDGTGLRTVEVIVPEEYRAVFDNMEKVDLKKAFQDIVFKYYPNAGRTHDGSLDVGMLLPKPD